jgi:hypothetical protein
MGSMDVKPCRFEDLHSYKEDCVEERNHHMAVCDTVHASKLAPTFPVMSYIILFLHAIADKVCYFAMENNVCLE